jgi:hypothetical protein
MNEGAFWEVVADLNWEEESKTRDGVSKVKRKLMARFTYEEIQELEAFDTAAYRRVSNAIEAYENSINQLHGWIGLGDDGFSDLINHIVGLGKEEVDRVCADPKLAKARADAGDFRESFGYCWPHREDYEKQQLSGFYAWIDNQIDEYTEMLSNMEIKVNLANPIDVGRKADEAKRAIERVLTTTRLLKAGKVKAFMEAKTLTVAAAETLRQIQGGHYMVDNLFNDVEEFLPIEDTDPMPAFDQWPEHQRSRYQKHQDSRQERKERGW